MKIVRITLLVLIILGVALLFTTKIWVPRLVGYIIQDEQHEYATSTVDELGRDIVSNNAEKEEKISVTEKCEDVIDSKICVRQKTYPSRSATIDFVEIENDTNEEKIIYTLQGFAPTYLAMSSDKTKVYYRKSGYEANGAGLVIMIDVNKATSTLIDINAYGKVSPNTSYYATYGDISSEDGKQFCNVAALHSNTLPAGAIKVLNFNTGEIKTVIEDKIKVFADIGWNKDSNVITYTEMESTGKMEYGCPEFINKKPGQVVYGI